MKSKQHHFLIPFWAIAVFMMSCIGNQSDTEREKPEGVEIYPEVVFQIVDDEPLRFYIESRGVVEPIQKITLIPRISGFVEEHNLEEGKRLEQGDLIIQFDASEWELNLEEAKLRYDKAQSDYDIQKRLSGDLNIQDGLVRINSGLAEAETAYERAKLNLSYTTMTAPFAGTISTRKVLTTGAYISAGTELGSLVNTRTVRIRFDVLESEISSLEEGMEVDLEDPAGNELKGRIVAVSPEIDRETKTGQVIVEVDNRDGILKTGMTVEGRVYVRSVTGKVRMPREALLERDGRTLVFRLQGNEVEWIYVTPEAMNNEWVIINHEDIAPGDTLAVDKHFSISHQQQVIPLMAN